MHILPTNSFFQFCFFFSLLTSSGNDARHTANSTHHFSQGLGRVVSLLRGSTVWENLEKRACLAIEGVTFTSLDPYAPGKFRNAKTTAGIARIARIALTAISPWRPNATYGGTVLRDSLIFMVTNAERRPKMVKADSATSDFRGVLPLSPGEFFQFPAVTSRCHQLFSAITPLKDSKNGIDEKNKENMIDSISGRLFVAFDEAQILRLLQNELHAWTSTYKGVFLSHFQKWKGKYRAYHTETNLCVGLEDGKLEWAFCSLPKLLGQPNGIQLKSPDDLHRAIAAFDTYIQTLMPQTSKPDIELTRLDVVLNLHLDPRLMLAIHRHARHPRIRRETMCYYNDHPSCASKDSPYQLNTLNTVVFNGTRIRISLYDKVRETLKMKGEWPEFSCCTRVEIQIKGAKTIAKLLGFTSRDSVTLRELEFDRCYRAFRSLMIEFENVGKMPAFKPNNASFLAMLRLCGDAPRLLGGVDPLDWYRVKKKITDKQFGELRRNVRKLQLPLHGFRWADVLPKDRLPDIVDVDAEGNERLVKCPALFPRNDQKGTIW